MILIKLDFRGIFYLQAMEALKYKRGIFVEKIQIIEEVNQK